MCKNTKHKHSSATYKMFYEFPCSFLLDVRKTISRHLKVILICRPNHNDKRQWFNEINRCVFFFLSLSIEWIMTQFKRVKEKNQIEKRGTQWSIYYHKRTTKHQPITSSSSEDNGIVYLIVSTLLICFSFSKYHLTIFVITKQKFGARLCDFYIDLLYAHTHTIGMALVWLSPYNKHTHICVINKRVMYMQTYASIYWLSDILYHTEKKYIIISGYCPYPFHCF